MIVYHGTDSLSAENIKENGIDLKCGEKSVDNGRGFYTTPNKEFALQRAKTATERKKSFHQNEIVTPAILEIEIDLGVDDIAIKKFPGCSDDWREFVLYNRLEKQAIRKWNIDSDNHNLDFKYDVVIDETADTGISKLISKLRYQKDMPDFGAVMKQIDRSNNPDWDIQVSFHTKKAISSCIKKIEIVEHIEVMNNIL